MGILRRGFAVFLAVLMLMSALPMTAFAEEEEVSPSSVNESGENQGPSEEQGPGEEQVPDEEQVPGGEQGSSGEQGPDKEQGPDENQKPDENQTPAQPPEEDDQENEKEIEEISPADDTLDGVVLLSDKSLSFSLRWLDNNDNSGTRPDVENAASLLSGKFAVSYTIVGQDGKFYRLENGSPVEVGEEPYFTSVQPNDGIAVADNWKVTFSVAEPQLPNGFTIQYYVEQTASISAKTNEYGDYQSVETEKQPLIGDLTFTEVPSKPFTAKIDWLDGDNRYSTRPSDFSDTNLTLMRYVYGSSNYPEAVEDVTITLGENGTITTGDLPRFDPNGYPYVYYMAPATDDGGKMQGPNQINDDEVNLNHTKSWYEPTIENTGEYGAVEKRLHEGGTMEALLTNDAKIEIKKEWKDDGDVSKRPKTKIVIYRTVVEDPDDPSNPGIFNKGVPNPGYDNAEVPTVNDTIVVGVLENGKLDLPMYGPNGRQYIYYAFETGLTGDYQVEIDNSEALIHNDDIKNALIENAKDQKYVINGGTITNINKANYVQPPTKIFEAAALQSMDVAGETKVTVKLQWRRVTPQGDWEDYRPPIKDEKGDPVLDENGQPTYGDVVTEDLVAFRHEMQSLTGTGVAVEKYDKDGHEMEFRWVETSITVWNHPDEFQGGEDFPIPMDENDMPFVWMNDLGSDGTDVGFRIKRGPNGEIINNLRGVYEVKAHKAWSVYGFQYDPYSYELTAGQPAETHDIREEAYKTWAIEQFKQAILEANANNEEMTEETAETQAESLYTSLTAEPAKVESVQFEVLRDGKPLFRGTKGENDPNPQFGTEEALRAMGYTDAQINKCIMDVEGKNHWEATTQFPRFDDGGHAYKYELKEISKIDGWGNDGLVDYTLGTVTDTILQEGTEHTIPQLTGSITNTRGKGETMLRFEVEKIWLDDSDEATRKPVQVSVYHLKDGEIGKALGTVALNPENNWIEIIAVPAVDDDTDYEHYLVLEDSVGGVPVTYDKGYQHIADNLGNINQDMFYDNEGLNFAMVENLRSGKIEDADNNLTHQYNVYIGYGKTEESIASYTIYNQRTGVINLKLSKKWIVGGEAGHIRDVEFQVKVTGGSFSGERFLAEQRTRFVSDSHYVISAQNPAVFELTKEDRTNSEETGEFILRSEELNEKLSSLRKYDTTGRLLSYEPVETAIYHANGTDKTVLDKDTVYPVLIDGDYLVTGMKLVETAYGTQHRSEDIYTWEAANTRAGTVPIVLRKVWQDDGPGDRPDIYFTVYRCLESDFDENNVTMENSEVVTTVKDKSLWQTTDNGTNNWLWLCRLDDQPRYDDQGRPYVYFAKESFMDGDCGYESVCYNGEKIDCLNPSGEDTEQTFEHSYKDLEDHLSIVMNGRDGVPLGEKCEDGQRYYPAVTVNYRKDSRTISGMKLWKMPQGQQDVDKTPFDVSLFVLTKKQNDSLILNTTLVDKVGDSYQIKMGEETIPAIGVQTVTDSNPFYFPGKGGNGEYITDDSYLWPNKKELDEYDDFGRTLYYYMGEYMLSEPNKDPDIGESFTGHQKLVSLELANEIINEFTPHAPYVQIDVEKTLKSEVPGIAVGQLTAPITFQLWCKAATGGNNDLMLAQVTVTWDGTGYTTTGNTDGVTVTAGTQGDERKFTLTFTKGNFQVPGKDEFVELPYYGPDGQPYTYYVKEEVPDGYRGQSDKATVERIGGKTSVLTTVGNFFRNLLGLEVQDPSNPWLPSGNVVLDKEENEDTYTGKVAFTNTYWANKTESTDVTVTKKWDDGDGAGGIHTEYRPKTLVLQLWRMNGDTLEPVRTNFKGTMIGAEAENEKVTVTASQNYLKASIIPPNSKFAESTVRIQIDLNHNGADKDRPDKQAGEWKVTVSNLPKYSPDGKAYKYIVKEVLEDNQHDSENRYENYVPDTSTDDTTLTNGLERVRVKMTKTWKKQPVGAEASEVTEAEFVTLWKLGALPNTITFQLQQRNAGDSEWVNVTGPTIPKTFDLSSNQTEALIIQALKDMKTGVQYSYLPKWVNGSKKEVEIEYCFKETMDWGNGKTTVLQFKAEANTMETEITGGSHITPEVTQKPTGGGTLGAYWNTYETQYDFTNTIPVRQLEVHKYWADGNNQDGIRPGLTITVTRDGGVGSYTFTAPQNNEDHYASEKIYVPLYQNQFNTPGANGENISIYTAAEEMSDKRYYSPLAPSTEQGETLFESLCNEYHIVAMAVDEGFINADGTAKCVERQTDEAALGFGGKNNQFVFANEQVVRKKLNLKAEKVWPKDPLGVSQPRVIYLQLQYRYSDSDTWKLADAKCGLSATDKATHELTSPTAVLGKAPWKTEWLGVLENKTGGPRESKIQYQVVEMLKNADGTYTEIAKNTDFPYTWIWSGFTAGNPVSGQDLTTEQSGTVTNTLKTVSLNLEKTFEGEYAQYLLPDSITFKLEYRVSKTSNWMICQIAGQTNAKGEFTVKKGTDGTFKHELTDLPAYSRSNEPIEYTVSEVSLKYGNDTVTASGNVAVDNWTGTIGAFIGNVTVTKGEKDAETGTWVWSAAAENTLPVTAVSATKVWDDEHNRDGLRGAITLVLNRDGNKFLEVTYDPSAPSLTVLDQNGRTIENPHVNVAVSPVADDGERWFFSFDDLPMYKNLASGRTENDKSVYTVAEKDKPNGYSDSVNGMVITNTYTPETFDLTAQKVWNDFDDHYGLRPDMVTFQLEYWNSETGEWTLVTQKALPYGNATGVYTTSTPSITITPDTNGEWTKTATWQNLRKHVWVNGEVQEIQYRVVETLPAYEGIAKYDPPIPVMVRTPLNAEHVTATVTNSLVDAKALTVVKDWIDQDNAYGTRPDSIVVQLQYSTDNGTTWNPVPQNGTETIRLTEDGNWTHTFTDLRNDYLYRVVELGMVYGGRMVSTNGVTHVVGAYVNEAYDVELLADTAQRTQLINTLQLTSFEVTKMWEKDDDYVGTHRPVSITVQLQSRPKPGPRTLMQRLESLYAYDGWENVMYNGEVVTKELTLASRWFAEFPDLPKYDNSGNELEYRAIEISMTMQDGTEIGLSWYDKPYDAAVDGNIITNTFRMVTLKLTKHWKDFHNLYGARPEEITLIVKDQTGREYPDAKIQWISKGSDTAAWEAEISNLPMYLPDGLIKAQYTVIEEQVKDDAGDRYEADEAVPGWDGKYDLTNCLIKGKGNVTLTKFGSRENGVKLAGAVYHLIRLDDYGIPTYYTGKSDPAWTYLRSGAANLTTDKNGTLTVEGLEYGRYQFVEVKAPAGYYLNKKPVEFTIDASNQNTMIQVFQVDRKLTEAPKTSDDFPLRVLCGLMTASACGLVVLTTLRKKRRK